MGVPRFYRWLSERYPKINALIEDVTLLPEFDHLYLDMNGIIHACSHGSDDVSETLPEGEMMVSIFAYVDRIVAEIVKPRKTLFVAVDGVAPRAKLNQQRSRRFGSARTAKEAAKDVENKKQLFDSNCITPGTEFMARVGRRLEKFVRSRVASNGTVWGGLEVVFSGSDVPGEGEHKIMQFIRERRDLTSGLERHCMYGQDADLIMLALATHEPHFSLLREVIDFGANLRHKDTPTNARKTVLRQAKTSDFQLLHLSVLREYVQLEFTCLGGGGGGGEQGGHWDLERLVDDFVFLTFFVGNDFLPHSPSLDIGEHAFERIFTVYRDFKTTKWAKKEFLTNRGTIADRRRLGDFVAALAAMEPEIFAQRQKDKAKHSAEIKFDFLTVASCVRS